VSEADVCWSRSVPLTTPREPSPSPGAQARQAAETMVVEDLTDDKDESMGTKRPSGNDGAGKGKKKMKPRSPSPPPAPQPAAIPRVALVTGFTVVLGPDTDPQAGACLIKKACKAAYMNLSCGVYSRRLPQSFGLVVTSAPDASWQSAASDWDQGVIVAKVLGRDEGSGSQVAEFQRLLLKGELSKGEGSYEIKLLPGAASGGVPTC
jgi:hypothetical protein